MFLTRSRQVYICIPFLTIAIGNHPYENVACLASVNERVCSTLALELLKTCSGVVVGPPVTASLCPWPFLAQSERLSQLMSPLRQRHNVSILLLTTKVTAHIQGCHTRANCSILSACVQLLPRNRLFLSDFTYRVETELNVTLPTNCFSSLKGDPS